MGYHFQLYGLVTLANLSHNISNSSNWALQLLLELLFPWLLLVYIDLIIWVETWIQIENSLRLQTPYAFDSSWPTNKLRRIAYIQNKSIIKVQ